MFNTCFVWGVPLVWFSCLVRFGVGWYNIGFWCRPLAISIGVCGQSGLWCGGCWVVSCLRRLGWLCEFGLGFCCFGFWGCAV